MCCDKDKSRVLSLFMNAVCMVSGGVMIFTCVNQMNSEKDKTIDYVFISIGVVVGAASIIGCCGVVKQKAWISWIYVVVLLAMVVLTTYMLTKYVKPEDKSLGLEERLKDSFYETDARRNMTEFSKFQAEHKCCGIKGISDYSDRNVGPPDSCYEVRPNKPYSVGCLQIALENVIKETDNIKFLGFVFLAVQAVSLLSVFVLAVNLQYPPKPKPQRLRRTMHTNMHTRF